MRKLLAATFVALLMVGCGENNNVINKEIDLVSEPYFNQKFGCSFRYPKSWIRQTPQLPTTLILLHSGKGQGSINLSVVPADRKTIEKYNEEYFYHTYKNAFPDLRINRVWQTQSIGRKYVYADYSFSMQTPEGPLPVRSLTLVALSNGNRFMLVCNTESELYDQMKPIFNMVTSTFLIL